MMMWIKFVYRFTINCIYLCVLALPLMLIGIIVLLPVAYFYDIGHYPRILRWFDSADPFVGRDTSVIESINKLGFWERYWWTAIRNPTNYFNYTVCGFIWNNPKIVTQIGSLDVGDSHGDVPGLKIIEVSQDNKTYYEYYYIHKWAETKCLRFRMGWKIGNPYKGKKGRAVQDVFVLAPYKSYSGL